MTTLVIGANGRIGRQFCELAAAAKVPVRAMVRHPSEEPFFRELGQETVVADLEEADFTRAFEGCGQLVFTAGSGPQTGPEKTLLVDLYGAIRVMEYAREHDFRRYIMVSAMRADSPLEAPEKLRPYMAAKNAADRILRASSLPYVIVKPGRLTDDEADGQVTLDRASAPEITVSRGNVARALMAVAGDDALRNCEFTLLDGNRPVEQAVAEAGR